MTTDELSRLADLLERLLLAASLGEDCPAYGVLIDDHCPAVEALENENKSLDRFAKLVRQAYLDAVRLEARTG